MVCYPSQCVQEWSDRPQILTSRICHALVDDNIVPILYAGASQGPACAPEGHGDHIPHTILIPLVSRISSTKSYCDVIDCHIIVFGSI